MTKEEIDKIVLEKAVQTPEVIETHISWVLLGTLFAFKIKKPIKYPFLDFSTLEKRRYYCEREIQLNRRLTTNLYLNVLPIREHHAQILIGHGAGKIIDYTVHMRKFDRSRQMNVLLLNNQVTGRDIHKLAERIAQFHQTAALIREKDIDSFQKEFNELKSEKDYLSKYLAPGTCAVIDHAINASDWFIEKNRACFTTRLKEGFFRDCHGDLHSRNIFFSPDPQPFDCIEFNDSFRAIDVVNEIAFLCMDLDAFGRHDLSELFLNCYDAFWPDAKIKNNYALFIYYKLYRANVRAKVNSLRARSLDSDAARTFPLQEAEKYLRLMGKYKDMLDTKSSKQTIF